jgi:nucleotide-binding universal stress UspA family protein
MKVLVPLDESEEAREIISIVAPLARAADAEVTLIAVIEPVADAPVQPFVSEPSADLVGIVGLTSPDLEVAEPRQPDWVESKEQAVARAEDEARDRLAPVADSLREAGISTKVEVVMAADASQAIVGFAQRQGMHIIAMTAQTRSGIRSVIQSSAAEAVVRAGIVPVLVLHPVTRQG